ncbi:GNAT family N-acetyltransferase [Anaeromicropila populeti]|uniref:Ribosomal-protein-alanine N-acetyltransferase n=1 Tax=Anaeromicropila populeti TaxID=37658 RepID=A0A1I6LGW1_9FIRM|nr:GNAT family protein [Anaeromicropila populeti]SFS02689.1 ribosomal-protein-alanine N-acetyltransferase [Anaeromicropila populeti]
MEYTSTRLVLKTLTPEWAPSVLDFYASNKETFEPWEPVRTSNFYTLSYQEALLTHENNAFLNKMHIRFWIFAKEEPSKIIGTICFHNILRGVFQSCMIGYKIDRQHTRCGFGTEAVSTAVNFLFENYGLHRINAFIHPSNYASISFIKHIGFIEEGIYHSFAKLNQSWEDYICFYLLNNKVIL